MITQLFYVIFLKWSGRDCDSSYTMVTVSLTLMTSYIVLLTHHYKVVRKMQKNYKKSKEL